MDPVTFPAGEAPARLCCFRRHYGPVCPDGLVMCCLCFDRFHPSKLSVRNGSLEDVCWGCAFAEMRVLAGRQLQPPG